jgi:hypothetical protein
MKLDPARGANAYVLTSLNKANPEGTRTALYTRGVDLLDGGKHG